MICEKCGCEYEAESCPLCKKRRRNEFFAAIAKAICYTSLFVVLQVGVQTGFVILKAFGAILGGASDLDAYTMILESIYANVCKLTTLSSLVTIFAVCLFFLVQKKVIADEIWFKPVKNSALGLAALFGAAAQPVITVGVNFVPWPESWVESLSVLNEVLVEEPLGWQVLAVAFLGPITEELIFRGLVYTRLRRASSPIVAAVLSSIAFGAIHGNMIQFFYAAAFGIVMALLMERYHSILPCLIVHIFFNGFGIVPYFDLPMGWFILVYVASVAVAIYTAYQIWFNKKDIQTERNTPDETV